MTDMPPDPLPTLGILDDRPCWVQADEPPDAQDGDMWLDISDDPPHSPVLWTGSTWPMNAEPGDTFHHADGSSWWMADDRTWRWSL